MKKLSLSIIVAISLTTGIFAQTPQSFKYQAIVRDLSGNIITNQLVAVKVSLLIGTETGPVVYSEVHSSTTNQFGTITLDIGKGSVVTGIFSAINWRLDDYFLKLEIDITGGTSFQFMGTSQLLSVPYALHAKTSEKFSTITSAMRDTMTVVTEGACFYNSTTKRLNFYNGESWFELTGNCEPQPTLANAGPDQTDVCAGTSLAGNVPVYGTGAWTIVSGTGGNVAEPDNPTSQFTGLEGITYVLNWKITNDCGFSEDIVTISMVSPGIIANAGPDQLNITTPTTLAGNDPGASTGLWSIVTGIGGNIYNPSNPLSQFSGDEGEIYTLAWTITSACGSNSDEVVIGFICQSVPTVAFAGPDQLNVQAVTTNLQANTPVVGTGSWSILTGTGGNILIPSNPTSSFTGLMGNSYTLRWTIATSHCGSTTDDVIVSFWGCSQIFTDYRDNQTYPTVLIGTQCWMAKNINIGTRIDGINDMLNNAIIEKYCIDNLETNCDVYGGLYQWSEIMQYSTTPGVQGICTPGWHVPTDNEWKILEGTIDTQYGVGDPIWDLTGDRGLDAGGKLKETGTVHWVFPNTGATNTSGFTALPGGTRNTNGTYVSFQIFGRFWTSDESSTNAYRRVLNTSRADILRDATNKLYGLSVRCVKD
jgi:uncharacterized protein (TIGR02145 family)